MAITKLLTHKNVWQQVIGVTSGRFGVMHNWKLCIRAFFIILIDASAAWMTGEGCIYTPPPTHTHHHQQNKVWLIIKRTRKKGHAFSTSSNTGWNSSYIFIVICTFGLWCEDTKPADKKLSMALVCGVLPGPLHCHNEAHIQTRCKQTLLAQVIFKAAFLLIACSVSLQFNGHQTFPPVYTCMHAFTHSYIHMQQA